ncbi:GNAT family N-acetyltransferase [Micromonospora siamensis]|uniref:Protein N-acetyltransferase, RimJ/RimL family n=1 Tax=Micromonospora siamensis TaxID=299152 RepID=A0A1C5HW22_9ACTN|nr:GNAT family N-acetyltransferase [Micromonospora siamensis]SCG50162.1 Protein N-acetyltransferase, RimJ/RimL family [Micromonospora siamensis]
MPTPVLRTPRLLLEPYRRADAEVAVALLTDPEVGRYMGNGPMGETQARGVFDRLFSQVYPQDRFAVWAVRRDGELVGHAEIKRTDDVDGHEIIYALLPSAWGAGLGSEIARAVVAHGFDTLGLSTVYATVAADNTASLALLDRLGFRHERDVTEDDGSTTRVLARHRHPTAD